MSIEDRVHINGLMEAVVTLTEVMTGSRADSAVVLPAASNAWSRIMPRMWIHSAFKFPVGVKLKDGWLRWHCGNHPLRVVTAKMLPKEQCPLERERQCVLRRKFKGVYHCTPLYTTVHITIHHCTPLYTTVHTTVHHCTPPHTTVHHHTPPYTCTPPHTTVHHHTPPYMMTNHCCCCWPL
jgi:hypothetical protein